MGISNWIEDEGLLTHSRPRLWLPWSMVLLSGWWLIEAGSEFWLGDQSWRRECVV